MKRKKTKSWRVREASGTAEQLKHGEVDLMRFHIYAIHFSCILNSHFTCVIGARVDDEALSAACLKVLLCCASSRGSHKSSNCVVIHFFIDFSLYLSCTFSQYVFFLFSGCNLIGFGFSRRYIKNIKFEINSHICMQMEAWLSTLLTLSPVWARGKNWIFLLS